MATISLNINVNVRCAYRQSVDTLIEASNFIDALEHFLYVNNVLAACDCFWGIHKHIPTGDCARESCARFFLNTG